MPGQPVALPFLARLQDQLRRGTNWIASGGKWTVPVGGGFGKLVRLGEQSIKLDVDAYHNAIRPKAGNETWLLQVTLTFILPD
jgi:hypothetical protein